MLTIHVPDSVMSDQTRLCDANGNILARDNFIVAFFGCRPFREMAGGARALVEQWLTIVPKDSVRWAVIGRNSSK